MAEFAGNKVRNILDNVSMADLATAFSELKELWDTGILADGIARAIARQIAENTGISSHESLSIVQSELPKMCATLWLKERGAFLRSGDSACKGTAVAKVYRHGKDSSGRPWHGINPIDGADIPEGALLYLNPQQFVCTDEIIKVLDYADSAMSYTEATVGSSNQPRDARDREWVEIHRGRAASSERQLGSALEKLRALRKKLA